MDIGTLIVDDESVTGEAASGAEAVEHAETDNPLVIVLDNMMPEMSGVEAATIIRSHRPTQVIIMCSAYLDQDVIDRARAVGVGYFLTKDQMRLLPALIREVVGARPPAA